MLALSGEIKPKNYLFFRAQIEISTCKLFGLRSESHRKYSTKLAIVLSSAFST